MSKKEFSKDEYTELLNNTNEVMSQGIDLLGLIVASGEAHPDALSLLLEAMEAWDKRWNIK